MIEDSEHDIKTGGVKTNGVTDKRKHSVDGKLLAINLAVTKNNLVTEDYEPKQKDNSDAHITHESECSGTKTTSVNKEDKSESDDQSNTDHTIKQAADHCEKTDEDYESENMESRGTTKNIMIIQSNNFGNCLGNDFEAKKVEQCSGCYDKML